MAARFVRLETCLRRRHNSRGDTARPSDSGTFGPASSVHCTSSPISYALFTCAVRAAVAFVGLWLYDLLR